MNTRTIAQIIEVPANAPLEQSVAVRKTNEFLSGATLILCLVAALLFIRFYRRTSDRLFLFFAAAFAILGVNRIFFLLIDANNEARTWLYAVRLVAFLLIIYAIVDKNFRRRPTTPDRPS
jgi:uncharacterized membrane protein HdeD (DUF308 family)